MARNLLFCAIIAVVCAGCVMNISGEGCVRSTESSCCEKPARVLRHVVLFKFKEGTSPQRIAEIEKAFAALPGKIDAICGFEWGTDVSVENRSEGFTHCFVVTFKDESGRAEYLPHPAHKEFVSFLGENLEKVLVLDYWTSR